MSTQHQKSAKQTLEKEKKYFSKEKNVPSTPKISTKILREIKKNISLRKKMSPQHQKSAKQTLEK